MVEVVETDSIVLAEMPLYRLRVLRLQAKPYIVVEVQNHNSLMIRTTKGNPRGKIDIPGTWGDWSSSVISSRRR
jgi:hypothetical protein